MCSCGVLRHYIFIGVDPMSKKNMYILTAISSLVLAFCFGLLLGILVPEKAAPVAEPIAPKTVYYKDGTLWEEEGIPSFEDADIKELQYEQDKLTYVSHSQGFSVALPADSVPDLSIAELLVRFHSEIADITVSREPIPEEYTMSEYMDTYLNKYILQDSYLKNNRITLHANETMRNRDNEVQVIVSERDPAPGSTVTQNTYVYGYIYTEPHVFYRFLFKADAYSDALMEQVYTTLYSFSEDVTVKGVSKNLINPYPIASETWSNETKALYNEIANAEKIKWGAFITGGVREKNREDVEALEAQIDYKLQFLLEYGCHFDPFPSEGMQHAYEMGKTVEFTMHISNAMNEDLDGYNPCFDVLDGVCDDMLRQFARDAKAFGHPFLFRLNNEMNSDWVSYGATATLNDPDVFVDLWHYVYRIFEEEGVDNAIWIFNPNNNSFPPQNYNHMLAYYPGNGYVHMFGITGYNTGTYYAKENNEKWLSFETLYDRIHWTSDGYFGKFPWIITEFASSSHGGNKAQWITDMFKTINKYESIKVAVWFNADDLDPRPEKNKQVARSYRLDESPKTIAAFRKGVAAYK